MKKQGRILYTLNHTYMCMGYNSHTIYATRAEAEYNFNEYVKSFKKENEDYIEEIHEDGEWEFYFEGIEGTERIYIEAVEIGLPIGEYVEDFGNFYELLDDVQESGSINMLDAYRILMKEFNMQKEYAKRIVKAWMNHK